MSQHSRVGSKVGDSEEEEAEVEAGDTEDIKLRLFNPTLSHFSPEMTAIVNYYEVYLITIGKLSYLWSYPMMKREKEQ